uniref:Uncharacterized protein n=1 Tax=Anopheles dirus TaxID=7168 RepID=A0A182MZR0_9DIPT
MAGRVHQPEVVDQLAPVPVPQQLAEEPAEQPVARRLPLLEEDPYPVPDVAPVLGLLQQPVARHQQTPDGGARVHRPVDHVLADAEHRAAAEVFATLLPSAMEPCDLVLGRLRPRQAVAPRTGAAVAAPVQLQTLQQPAFAAQHEVRVVDGCLPLHEHGLVGLEPAYLGPVAAVAPLLVGPPIEVGEPCQRIQQVPAVVRTRKRSSSGRSRPRGSLPEQQLPLLVRAQLGEHALGGRLRDAVVEGEHLRDDVEVLGRAGRDAGLQQQVLQVLAVGERRRGRLPRLPGEAGERLRRPERWLLLLRWRRPRVQTEVAGDRLLAEDAVALLQRRQLLLVERAWAEQQRGQHREQVERLERLEREGLLAGELRRLAERLHLLDGGGRLGALA